MTTTPPTAAAPAPPPSRPTRVLVADDEGYLADLVSTALRYEGFETAVASTGGRGRTPRSPRSGPT
ncbi:hypothetical protein [Actinomadura rugatobispora]|uniref:Response regulatory domain-containing protein n=1 Tax=Actinomadura rugatobispora TaxID=1994 RepID=A0ABW0ZX11_9ACTN